ncbi:unknown [Clostridium sp. CAG:417]|nr:unknown [Clostridium sp. CAG:417]
MRKVDTNSKFANSLLPILFGKRIVLEDCSLDLCYFENMNLVIPIEKYFKKSMNIYDLKKCDEYKEGTWTLNDLIEYIKLKKLSEQNEQEHIIDIARNNIMDILENQESDAKVRLLHK